MNDDAKTKEELLAEIEDLRIRLEEAEETLRAIRGGEVDGLVVSGPEGDRLFLLKGAGHAYRVFVEAMNEGAVTLSHDGTILYCNDRFADMVETDYEKVIGHSIYQFVASIDVFESAFERAKRGKERVEVLLKRKDAEPLPVYLSLNPLLEDEAPGICVVVTDLEALKESEKQLKYLASKLLAAHEEERKRIAGELHDSVASSVGAVIFSIEKILGRMKQDESTQVELRELISKVQQVNEETRRIISDLRPSVLDDLGVVPAINWFCREYERVYSHIRVEKQIDLSEGNLRDSQKTAIYRVFQEAMNNVAKHSQASLVSLYLQERNGRIEMRIQDNGQGFDLDTVRRGLGLSTMRERAQLSGGSFDLESVMGKGTIIRVSWPLVFGSQ